MRNAFAKELTELAAIRDDICLLSGDIGNKMFDNFKSIAKSRFLNCGIAEANMMSVASGMALAGLRPIVYTITPFTTIRCLEQIRIGVAYHQSPVIIVGTGSGLSYSELGPTHHSLEDIAIIRTIPDINVLAPSDSNELIAHLRDALKSSLPTYMRIGKKGEPIIYEDINNLGIGKSKTIKNGNKNLILGTGTILNEVIKAASLLKEDNYQFAVAGVGSIKPLDSDFLLQMASQYNNWFTVEEHGIVGGFGSALLEWLEENNMIHKISLKRFGVSDKFIHNLGNQQFTRENLGLDSKSLYENIKKLITK